MTHDLRHRGPDGDGYFFDGDAGSNGGLALGHRRLAILDLSEAARQPLTSRDGRWTIALNGEIFNYRELRAEIGGDWRTSGDTEVLLEACAKWGVERTLERANGMFAFALWDAQRRELTLGRDRVGEKPLVYCARGASIAFASELKALKRVSAREVDAAAVDAYLALGYIPAPLTILRDCRKLAPGHLLRFRDGEIEIRRWWFPENAEPAAGANSEERTRELVRDAVRLRLRSDVPVALLLSGGIDSSMIAAECAALGARPRAFTVAFDGEDAGAARAVARRFGLDHEVMEASGEELARNVGQVLRAYDEPFADTSALPAFAIAKALRGRFKVVLSGDGGDEAFAGYRHYEHIAAKQVLKSLASAAGMRDGWGGGALGVYVESKALFRRADRVRMVNGHARSGRLLGALLGSDEFLKLAAGGALKRALWTDRHLYLANDLTYKMDIALGAQGMEGRAPLLDHRLLEWTQGWPERELVRGAQKKVAARAAYRGIVPDAALDGAKRGFGAPIARWMGGPLREFVDDMQPCELLESIPHGRGARNPERQWALAALSNWAREWKATW